ncbi:6-phospho-3-hexuloisomerase [Parageobacillus thermoglucosidasius]|uniref:6-phospho 3-hexuloisomerase n=3 Tax=Anoxybacillaceae TaxID=3120669 RepID=A0A7U3YHB2_GEOS0|nr:6-phospho-3-hexuloisomerase [Parageobacillus thermoglucosidasius]RDE33971.1 6-phospho-3-hexuloisomerase [Parageobacillus thermoglucosidasius]GMN99511.1 6-phospho-3-hexuloisomerase [Parageobacillus thermoglucosidasius]
MMMQTTQYLGEILQELNRTADFIADEEAEKLVNGILQAKKIFVAGAGRSGFMSKSFAMRMMHMGLDAYVVGETITPNLEQDDILIIGSGSGETRSLVSMAEKAKSLGATIALVTIFPASTIGKLADITVKLPGSPKDQADNGYKTIQPMGSLFEQTLLLFYDAVILRCMEKKGLDSNTMFKRHANLE